MEPRVADPPAVTGIGGGEYKDCALLEVLPFADVFGAKDGDFSRFPRRGILYDNSARDKPVGSREGEPDA